MRVFLAGLKPFLESHLTLEDIKGVYSLESFYYADKTTEKYIQYFKDFLLDSGAYTFFAGKNKIAWEDYVDRYADFINRNKVDKFFDLDIDKLVGYDKVKEFEKMEILRTLEYYGNDLKGKKAAARELGISLASLYAKLK